MLLPFTTNLEMSQHSKGAESYDDSWSRKYTKRQKVVIASLLGITLAVGAVACTSYSIVRGIILRNLQQQTLLKTIQGSSKIDQWLSTREAELSTIAHSPILQTGDWSKIEPYLKAESQRLKEVFFLLYAEPSGLLGSSKDGLLSTPFFDRDWYQRAISGSLTISDPSISRSTGEVIIRISSPVRTEPNGKPRAVVSSSITVQQVLDVVESLKQGPDSYAFALNSQGVAIAHPDLSLVGTPERAAPSLLQSSNLQLATIARRMVHKQEGIELITLNGIRKYIIFTPLKQADWSIALVVSQEAIESNLDALNMLALVLGVLLVFVLWVAWKQVQAFERTRLQTEQLNSALRSLKSTQSQLIHSEKMSSLGKMVAGIAHEINNPINFIHANIDHAEHHTAELLALIEAYQSTNLPSHAQNNAQIVNQINEIDLPFIQTDLPKIFNSMKHGSDRIRDIVLGLRNFSRLDESSCKLVDLSSGMDNALMILRHRLEGDGRYATIQVERHYANIPLIYCCAGDLNQVFLSLLSNAIDALQAIFRPIESHGIESYGMGSHGMGSDVGSPREISNVMDVSDIVVRPQDLKIVILIEEVADGVRIQVSDNGCGIPQAIQSQIFDPFFTTKPVGQGTGLGLAISHQVVVNQHHGKLWCDSIEGQGTTFTVEIPRHPPEVAPSTLASNGVMPSFPSPHRPKLLCLLP